MGLEDTSAGRIITAELRKREEKKRQELLEEEREEAMLLQARKEKEAQLRAAEEQILLQARTRPAAVPRRQPQSQVYTGVDELVRQQNEGQWGSTSQGGQSSGSSSIHGRDQYGRPVRVLHKGKKRPGGALGSFFSR